MLIKSATMFCKLFRLINLINLALSRLYDGIPETLKYHY